jgi:hypothetical protein
MPCPGVEVTCCLCACSMPKVQAILKELNRGSDLTKNLNGDETFAMGGAYEVGTFQGGGGGCLSQPGVSSRRLP